MELGTYYKNVQQALDGTQLTPYFKIWTGDVEWNTKLKKYVSSISLKKRMGLIADDVTISINDPEFTFINYGSYIISVGAPMKIELGIEEDSDRSNFLFGNIQKVDYSFPASGIPTVNILIESVEQELFKQLIRNSNGMWVPYHTYFEDTYKEDPNVKVRSWVLEKVIKQYGFKEKGKDYEIDSTEDDTLVNKDEKKVKSKSSGRSANAGINKTLDKTLNITATDMKSDYEWIKSLCGNDIAPDFIAYLDRGKFYFKRTTKLLAPDMFNDANKAKYIFSYRKGDYSLGRFSVSTSLAPFKVQLHYHSSAAKDMGKTSEQEAKANDTGKENGSRLNQRIWDVTLINNELNRLTDKITEGSK